MESPTTHTKAVAIVGRGTDENQGTYLRLDVEEQDGRFREEILSIADFSANRGKTIRDLHLPIISPAANREFLNRVHDAQRLPLTFDVATRSGWFGRSFVKPNGIVKAPKPVSRPIKAHFDPAVREFGRKYATKGDLAGWGELGRLSEGNTRLMMSLALSLVGPLVDLIGGDPPMVQLVGPAQSGKSSIAIAAGSVWGEHDSRRRKYFIETWDNTANALEPVAAAHFGTFLVLDETLLADRSRGDSYAAVSKVVMNLFAGRQRGRGNQQARRNWWMGVLSTSNKSLDDIRHSSRG
jgi:putative DNA primase/helicase